MGPTQFGRASSLDWKVPERRVPAVFGSLELFIVLEGRHTISRNHAGIVQGRSGDFFLYDLRSLNGTLYNDERLPPDTAQTLSIGDVIDPAGKMPLRVCEIRPNTEQHHAILVSSGLETGRSAIDELAKVLSHRGFDTDVMILHDPTISELTAAMHQLALRTTDLSRTIFAFVGLASPDGLAIGRKRLSIKRLYRLLRVRGRKAVILDCPDGDSLVSGDHIAHLPPRTMVMYPTDGLRVSFSGIENTEPGQVILETGLTDELIASLKEHRERTGLWGLTKTIGSSVSMRRSVAMRRVAIPDDLFDDITIASCDW